MEFLDLPLVKLVLMAIAFGMLVSWLFGRLLPYLDKGPSEKRRQELDRLIAGLSAEERDKVEASIAGKRKIEGIKFFREITGVGLRDAKDAVEYMIRKEKAQATTAEG